MSGYVYGLLLFIFRMYYLTRFLKKNFPHNAKDSNVRVFCACAFMKLEKYYVTELRPNLAKSSVINSISDEDGEVEENAKPEASVKEGEKAEVEESTEKVQEATKKPEKDATVRKRKSAKDAKESEDEEETTNKEKSIEEAEEEEEETPNKEKGRKKKKKKPAVSKHAALLPDFPRKRKRGPK